MLRVLFSEQTDAFCIYMASAVAILLVAGTLACRLALPSLVLCQVMQLPSHHLPHIHVECCSRFTPAGVARLRTGGGAAGGLSADDLRAALRSAEDEDDAAAAAVAEKEAEAEMDEFTAEPPPEEAKDDDLEGLEGEDAPSRMGESTLWWTRKVTLGRQQVSTLLGCWRMPCVAVLLTEER